ncbi:MAG: hypothetical protein GXP14_02610 [Gammaproteobacteria bacterium]|nr:hypothetical protein [Gammaproteobacteria bacterium]
MAKLDVAGVWLCRNFWVVTITSAFFLLMMISTYLKKCPVYPSVEYLLPNAHEMFNENRELTSQVAQRRLVRYVNGFIEWIEQRR